MPGPTGRFATGQDGQNGRVKVLARIGGRRIPLAEPRLWLIRRALRRRIGHRPPDLDPNELGGFSGVKILPQLDGIPDAPMLDAIADLRLPVLSHSGRFVPASWLAKRILPKTTGPLILAHLGAFPAEADLLDEALDLAETEPRVYLDTSGIWECSILEKAIARVPRKLIFGSDCPLTHPAVALRQVTARIPDGGLRARITGGLAEEIFT